MLRDCSRNVNEVWGALATFVRTRTVSRLLCGSAIRESRIFWIGYFSHQSIRAAEEKFAMATRLATLRRGEGDRQRTGHARSPDLESIRAASSDLETLRLLRERTRHRR